MRTVLIVGFVLVLLCGFSAADCIVPITRNIVFDFNPVPDMPRIPHTFGGCVVLDGKPAPAGTILEVRGMNVYGPAAILILQDNTGCFGQGTFDPKLTAMGTPVSGGMLNIPEGTALSFYVNRELARVCLEDGTCWWFHAYHTGFHSNIILKAGVDCQAVCSQKG